jgi:hypothetical protein
MGLVLQLEGHPGQAFAEVVRLLPDGADWLLSDLEGTVVIARSDGEQLLREAILSPVEDRPGTWEVECLASPGVHELALQGLVATAVVSSPLAVLAVWWAGYGGLMGLIFGVCVAGGVPSIVMAIGQRLIDPGRDVRAEAQLERALRYAVAQAPRATLKLDEPAPA